MNLTPAAIIGLVAAALLGVAGTWSDAVGEFPWWRLVVALLVIGLVFEFLAVRERRVSARWRTAERLFLGRIETLRLELTNESPYRLAVQTVPVLPEGLVEADTLPGDRWGAGGGQSRDSLPFGLPPPLELPAGKAASLLVAARPVRLGTHAWPTLPVRVLGPFGLAWWSRKLELGSAIAVRPDTLSRGSVGASAAEQGAAAQSKLGGGHELHHLREYRPGDPRHTIDWKASARSSGLITRVFSEDQHLEIVVLLDAGRTSRTEIDGMSQLGHYVNLAARFAEYCSSGDDRVGLIAFADRPLRVVPPGRGVEGVTRIRLALADLEPQPVESDALEAALRVRRLVRHRCLVIVLTDLYESSATSRLAQTARLLAPKHLPMMVGLSGDEVAQLANGEARDWLDPYRGLAAREYERQVHANVARLGELGALAMTARPAELERKVLGAYRLLRVQHRV